jgi:transcriptional regulator with XRE-family HTH domain
MPSLALQMRPCNPALLGPAEEDRAEARLLGEALKRLREKAGISQELAGEEFGVTGQGWYKYESGNAPTIFKPGIQRRLTAALGASIEDLYAARAQLTNMFPRAGTVERLQVVEAGSAWSTAHMIIRRRVQAGAWLAVEDGPQTGRAYPAAPDQRFPRAQQWLSEVVGDSMDLLGINEGDLVHCVDVVDIGYHPRTGDVVEVERLRFQGSEVEVTIKHVEITIDEVKLWPRSRNPRWAEPLELSQDVGEQEDFEVRISGLVLSSIRRFHSILDFS